VFALWSHAVLEGRSSPDEAADAIAGGSTHRVVGLLDGEMVSLPVALASLRSAGSRTVSAALPIPGDPVGIVGPRAFVEAAVTAGQVVLVPDQALALIPAATNGSGPHVVLWQAWTDLSMPPPTHDLATAARTLREAVLEAATELAELDAPPTPGAEPTSSIRLVTPPGLDPRAHDLLERASRLLVALQSALRDPTVATSARLDSRRRAALVPVERAARHALVAATQPVLAARPR
jgi:hypothetical protein